MTTHRVSPHDDNDDDSSPRRSARLARPDHPADPDAATSANSDGNTTTNTTAAHRGYQVVDSSDDDMDYIPPLGTFETDDDGDDVDILFEDATDEQDEFLDAEEGDDSDEDEDEDEDDTDTAGEEQVQGDTGAATGDSPELGRNQLVALLNLLQSGDGEISIVSGDGEAVEGENMTQLHTELMELIRGMPLRRVFIGQGQDETNEEAESAGGYGGVSHRRPRGRTSTFPPIPNPQGTELMESGDFGLNDRQVNSFARQKKLASTIMQRELGLESPGKQRSTNRLASQHMIPSSDADTIIHYDTRCYSGQFSDDGNFFFSCAQDFHVRMYDTSNPYDWRYYKTVLYPYGQWTITDASLSPNNKYLAYSSIRSVVCLAATDPHDDSDPHLLDFSNMGPQGRGERNFGIWSVRFSGDNREIVAGTSDNAVIVYDVEAGRATMKIPGHKDDVNAVCFGDKASPHILYSGSDDSTLKVWDRRSMNDRREAGVFLGHTEGLTYVDSKGDGRYVLSNGKDQNMKLWDLRRMMSTERAEKVDPDEYSTGFDYRFQPYNTRIYHRHPHDCSLVTFRGHRVLKTLIRCHFSPPGSTDSRYVYSGSEDGSVYIWNMDATLAGTINVNQATEHTRPHGDEDLDMLDYRGTGTKWKTCVRDASWHPNAPVLAATSWNGYGMSHGTCTVHSWNDGARDDEAEPKMGLRVDARLNHDRRYYGQADGDVEEYASNNRATRRAGLARTRLRRRFISGDDDD